MKIYSNAIIARLFVGLFFTGWLLILLIITMNHSLSCINDQGCLRSSCKYSWLRPEYKDIVSSNSANCPYQVLD